MLNEDCSVVPFRVFQTLDEKVTYFNLEFFQPRNYLKQKFEFNTDKHIRQEVPAEAVFCTKMIARNFQVVELDDSDHPNYSGLHVFKYSSSGLNFYVEVPKFRGLHQLATTQGVFHTAKHYRQVTLEYQALEDRYKKHVKEQLTFKHPEG
jgi:hypothetical protein